ncbi:MAG: Rpn family recombination-promoting nuclease/putative transposase [Synergistaceae bacterium]|nr:Rpn family recombination-promoting nuclease/putative transposase [Synergistaceae bacterium]
MPDDELSNIKLESIDADVPNESDTDPFSIDGIWKDFIAEFWREILQRFLPALYNKADLEHEPEFLDKELRDLLANLEPENQKSKTKYVDNLLKIFLKDGGEEWVLLHIEIQGRGGENFSLRMFRYYCLIFTHHNEHPAALAILTAKRPKKDGEPGIYNHKFFGTEINYKYNIIKAYEFTDEELKSIGSLVDLFIYALKKSKENRKSNSEKFKYMKEILRLLAEKDFSIQKRRMFIIFLERAMSLSSQEYRELFYKESDSVLNGGKKMIKYHAVIDDVINDAYEKALNEGRNKGFSEGRNKGRKEGRKEGRNEGQNNILREFIKSGLLSDEQIASVAKQPIENIAKLRSEIEMATV